MHAKSSPGLVVVQKAAVAPILLVLGSIPFYSKRVWCQRWPNWEILHVCLGMGSDDACIMRDTEKTAPSLRSVPRHPCSQFG